MVLEAEFGREKNTRKKHPLYSYCLQCSVLIPVSSNSHSRVTRHQSSRIPPCLHSDRIFPSTKTLTLIFFSYSGEMCSANSTTSFLFLPTKTPSLLQRSNSPIFNPPRPFLCYLRPPIATRHITASIAEKNFGLSWVSPNQNSSDDFGGWAFVEYPVPQKRKRSEFQTFFFGFKY